MPIKQKRRQWPHIVGAPANKSTAALRLKTLPPEIVHQIIPFLDPIALISLSQTGRHLRRLISPGRADFVDRLLALECLDEYGGSASIIHAHICPPPASSSAEWDNIKWACTSCMRLLPHVYFDNHSILRFGSRKPIPGTPAGDVTTKWRVSLRGKVRGSKAIKHIPPLELNQRRRGQGKKDDWKHPANVSRYLNRLQEVGIAIGAIAGDGPPTLEAKQAAMDQVLDSLQCHRWGFKRYLRKCHECRSQAGEFNQPVWLARVPCFRTSRQFVYAGALERYFPEYWAVLKHQRPQLPQDRVMEVWTTFMGRCHICRKWQEMRSFRLGLTRDNNMEFTDKSLDDYNMDWFDYYDSLECNHCVAKTQGHEALGKILLKWISELISEEEGRIYRDILQKGFEKVRMSLFALSRTSDTESEQRSQLETMFVITPETRTKYIAKQEVKELLTRHHELIKTTWEDLLSHDPEFSSKFGENSSETGWVRKLAMYKAYWVWLDDTSRELNERPLALVRWVINKR
ncbi:unnamed protein product [Clonostachys rosea]|uniref:F-box domain-containing protein n=1 Tax=Bionectria ochroleuca TaxID=29856 RepID=A0ABY6U298_BIOOC|nr:unnamed protein product [Clonostachys rosea]